MVVAGKYQLETLVGEGGMASVWSALNLQLGSHVALKLLRAGEASAELRERLKIEARVSAQLVHPNIVRVFDAGETEQGEPFVVMELLDGEPLSHLAARGPISSVRAVQLMLPIAEALVLAHDKGIVHRDLKPDNVFLSTSNASLQPKLLDFGIAKLSGHHSTSSRQVTQDGTLIGSPDYMSPEQAQGTANIDHRSDIWSFCVVLYELITQRPPFGGGSNVAVLYSIIEHEPAPFAAEAGVDDSLSQIIQWGLRKDPDLRPKSMEELGSTLAAWLMHHGVLEDACGASLEAKWNVQAEGFRASPGLPRSALVASVSRPATLASQAVIAPTSESGLPRNNTASSRGRRLPWLLTALATALGLAAVWASTDRKWTATVRTNEAVPRIESQLPARLPLPTSPLASPTPVSTIKTLVEPVPAASAQADRSAKTEHAGARQRLPDVDESPTPTPSRATAVELMQPY